GDPPTGATQPSSRTTGERPNMSRAAEEAIDSFRRGERFTGSVAGFVEDGKADERAVEVLWKALAAEPERTREQIAKLLVAIGLKVDPQGWAGGGMIRDRRIIAVLIDAGLGRGEGLGRDASLDGLQQHVPPDVLREFEAPLVANLEKWPDSTAF